MINIIVFTLFAAYIGVQGAEYFAVLLAGFSIFVVDIKAFSRDEIRFISVFYFFIFLMSLSSIVNDSFFSIRTILGGISTGVFFVFSYKKINTINYGFFVSVYSLLIMYFLFLFGRGETPTENTLSGVLAFLIIFYFLLCGRISFLGFCFLAVSAYLIFKLQSRTSFFILIIFLLSYCFFAFFSFKRKALKNIYSFLVLFLVSFFMFYINIELFDFYDSINAYSLEYFGKNINSGRGEIWLSAMQGDALDILFGYGTGKLPTIDRYSDSSFHSSFIQLYYQNGILGMLLFIYILSLIWQSIIMNNEGRRKAISLAAFISIVVYNCFETTLLSNKISLGLLEWLVLGTAVNGRLSLIKGYQYKYER